MAHIGNSPASYFTAVTTDVFSANGTANSFTLSKYISNLADIEVIVNNIQQNPFSGSYSVSNNTLTFSEAPIAGSNNVVVTYRQATIGSTIPTPNTVGNNALQRDLSLTGNTTTQHLVPAANITYDIGTTNMRYRDLYLSGNTINLGDIKLSTNGTTFSVANATGGVFASALGNTVITGTLTSNAHTMTGNLSVTGTATVNGVVTFANSTGNTIYVAANGFTGIGTSSPSSQLHLYEQGGKDAVLTITPSNSTYDATINFTGQGGDITTEGLQIRYDNDVGDAYIRQTYSGLANNDPAIRIATAVTPNAMVITSAGYIGIGNTTPYNSAWGANTHQLTIGSNKAYGVLNINGNGGSTRFSTGAGDGIYYMAYDNVNAKHHIRVYESNGIQFQYQLQIHGTPGNGTRGSSGFADRFATSYSRGTLSFSNSRITVPLGGVYLILFQTICDAGSGRIDTEVRVNGSTVSNGLNSGSDGPSDYRMRTHSLAIQLSASDYIQFYSGNWYATGNSYDQWGIASVTLLG